MMLLILLGWREWRCRLREQRGRGAGETGETGGQRGRGAEGQGRQGRQGGQGGQGGQGRNEEYNFLPIASCLLLLRQAQDRLLPLASSSPTPFFGPFTKTLKKGFDTSWLNRYSVLRRCTLMAGRVALVALSFFCPTYWANYSG